MFDDQGHMVSSGVFSFIDDRLLKYSQRQIVYEDELDEMVRFLGVDTDEIGPVSLWLMALADQWPALQKAFQTSLSEIATWLARFLACLKSIKEDERILDLVRDKLKKEPRISQLKRSFSPSERPILC